MALNIPNVGNNGQSFLSGLNSGSSMYSRIMQPIIAREQMKKQKELQNQQLAQTWKQHLDNLGIQKDQQARLNQMMPWQLQHLKDVHSKTMFDQDPQAQLNMMAKMMQGAGMMGGGQGSPQNNAPQQGTMPLFNGQGMISDQGGQPMTTNGDQTSPSSANGVQPGNANNNGGIPNYEDMNPLQRAIAKRFKFDVKPYTYQGAAREAIDLEKLKKEKGEGSEVYQTAKGIADAKKQEKQDLSLIRNRTIDGLKPGERWIQDPNTKENIGVEHNLSEKERGREMGRTFFNELYPIVYNGAAPFSGEGSIRKLEDVASRYNTDPKARKIFDDYLLSEKALTAAIVNEAATLDAGKTNQVYKQLRESLIASDIPKKINSLIKQYQIPASAQLKAGISFQKLINETQSKANKMTPATRKLYFNPEDQAKKEEESNKANETNQPNQTTSVIITDPSGKKFETTEENAANLPKGWKRD